MGPKIQSPKGHIRGKIDEAFSREAQQKGRREAGL